VVPRTGFVQRMEHPVVGHYEPSDLQKKRSFFFWTTQTRNSVSRTGLFWFRVSTVVTGRKHEQCLIYFLAVNLTYRKLSHNDSIINVHVQDITFSKQRYIKYGHHYYKCSLEPNFLLSDTVNTCTTQVTVTR